MFITFKYPCLVGIVFSDGHMTSITVGCGEKLRVSNCDCITLKDHTHRDFELEDGTLLRNVPTEAYRFESA